MAKIDYSEFSDEKLTAMCQAGDENAENYLLTRHKSTVISRARTFYLVGGDRDDLIQEGMIALYKAIRSYTPDKNTSFLTFASVCIDKKLASAVEKDQRLKNKPLNESVSIFAPVSSDAENSPNISDVLASNGDDNPENIVLGAERMKMIFAELSSFETEVLTYYVNGLSYEEIGQQLGKSSKSIDNAIQRIRAKIKKN